jgi:predicted dehydrogenase
VSQLQFGLIGTGFMGKAHAIALNSVATVFDGIDAPVLATVVDTDLDRAKRCADEWGFAAASDDWTSVCSNPEIDVVDICTPNHLHKEMALAAISANKNVYCEKPLALTGKEASEILEAARAADTKTSMGFNYLCNPLIGFAREMIAAGEIGEVFNYRGSYQEDYLSNPATPFSWRCLRSQGGQGALADLGTHLINMAEFLLGPIQSVFGTLTTVHEQRPDPVSGEARTVENDDIAQALLKFSCGCPGTMEISRIATGRKCGLTFEIHGTKGSLHFDQERMNELRFYDADDAVGRHGLRTILAGPEHPDYAAFCPASGHGLGINDLKIIEVRNLLRSIDSNGPIYADFENGCRVQHLTDAIERSHEICQWVDVADASQSRNVRTA